MKEQDLHRAKCPTNISDRRTGEGGGGVDCKGRAEVGGAGRKLPRVKRPLTRPTRGDSKTLYFPSASNVQGFFFLAVLNTQLNQQTRMPILDNSANPSITFSDNNFLLAMPMFFIFFAQCQNKYICNICA